MPYVSDLYVTLTLDPSGYTTGVNSAVTSTKKLEGEFTVLDAANRKTATGLRALGTSAAMLGSGVAMAEPKLAGFAIATSNIGMITAMVGPELKAINFLHGELATKVKEATLALEGERLVLASTVGIMSVGLIAGLIAWKLSSDEANKKLEEQKKALESVNKAAQDYLATTEKLQTAQDKLAGRPQEKADLELKLRQQGLAIVKAQDALQLPGTKTEQLERSYAYTAALIEYDKTRAVLGGFDAGTSKLQGEVTGLSRESGMLGLQKTGTPFFYKDTYSAPAQVMGQYVPAGTATHTIHINGDLKLVSNEGMDIRYSGIQNGVK